LSAVREGVRRYSALLSLPGAKLPVVASSLGSLPIGMFGLAILLLARESGESFAVAGRIVGAFGLGNALGAVIQGRLMDRIGQPRVLRTAAAGHALALIALVIAAEQASAWVLTVFAALGGLFLPQLPAAMRSLWGSLVRDSQQRETAYAMVTIAFEVTVMTAPALAALVIATVSPSAAVLLAGAIATTAAIAFAATTGSRGWRGEPHDVGWVGPLVSPGMRTTFVVMIAFGTSIGIVQVLLPAFADERGSAESGGLLLALLSAGSLLGGLVYGARTWPGPARRRLALLMLALGAGWAVLAAASATAVLAVLLIACGTLLAPISTTSSTLLDGVAPVGTVTEAFAVMVMGIVVGTAIGNALGGAIVDGASYETGALTAAAIAVLGAAVAVARRQTLVA
jgi:predicted MFS family arabinose efflux permease